MEDGTYLIQRSWIAQDYFFKKHVIPLNLTGPQLGRVILITAISVWFYLLYERDSFKRKN